MIKKNKRLTTVSIQKYSNNNFEFKICFEYKQENHINSSLSITIDEIKLFLSSDVPKKIYSKREIFYIYNHNLKK